MWARAAPSLAVEAGNIGCLADALSRAREEGLTDLDLEWAKGHLERLQDRLRSLRHAQQTRSIMRLKQDLELPKSTGLDDEDSDRASELLERLRAVQMALHQSMESGHIGELERALRDAKEVGLCNDERQQACQQLERLSFARDGLAKVLDTERVERTLQRCSFSITLGVFIFGSWALTPWLMANVVRITNSCI